MTVNTTGCVFPQQADSFLSTCNKNSIYEGVHTQSVSLGYLDASGTIKWNMDYFLWEDFKFMSIPSSSRLVCVRSDYWEFLKHSQIWAPPERLLTTWFRFFLLQRILSMKFVKQAANSIFRSLHWFVFAPHIGKWFVGTSVALKKEFRYFFKGVALVFLLLKALLGHCVVSLVHI